MTDYTAEEMELMKEVALTTEVVMFLARNAAQDGSPGDNDYGNVAVRYFPTTHRYQWFVDGKRTSKFDAMCALAEMKAKEQDA